MTYNLSFTEIYFYEVWLNGKHNLLVLNPRASVSCFQPYTPYTIETHWLISTFSCCSIKLLFHNSMYLDIIWVIISVEINGILGVTQQMNELPIGQKFTFNSHINPFAPATCQTLQSKLNSCFYIILISVFI